MLAVLSMRTKLPFTTRSGGAGRYDQSDNAVFTANADEGRDPTNYSEGWNLNGSAKRSQWGALHPLATLMWISNSPSDQPELETFEHAVHNASIFANTQQSNNRGRVWPHNAEGFILVSPGKDGLYGTQDDVRNY
ncbi:MAG: hypothetical protein IH986_01495 [Planctomycetes bacterium]|nr:hypothetical protein [Planctomycetota bacterium]